LCGSTIITLFQRSQKSASDLTAAIAKWKKPSPGPGLGNFYGDGLNAAGNASRYFDGRNFGLGAQRGRGSACRGADRRDRIGAISHYGLATTSFAAPAQQAPDVL
jgi:hypothetical protein